MALDDDKEKKLNKAIINDLEPSARTSNGGRDKAQWQPHYYVRSMDVRVGMTFRMTHFPRDEHQIIPLSFWGNDGHYESSARARLGTFISNDHFIVSVICAPSRGSDLVYVERWPDGKRAVVPLTMLDFDWCCEREKK